jgi:UDP-glucose 4-epimerase
MQYIVTGGAGYIGGHLTDRLVSEGNEVMVLDDLSSGKYENSGSRLVKVNLIDSDATGRLQLPRKATFVHLAADPNVRSSMDNVVDHFDRDVTATLNTLELARRSDAKSFLFTSSSVVYGDAKKMPTPETYQLKPISNYGIFKMMSEELVEYYSRTYGIKSTSLRLANITGGRATHGIVPDFINKLRKDQKSLEILGDGKQRKSYVYMTDLIDAIMLVISRQSSGYRVLNVGNSDSVSVNEMAGIISGEMGLKPKYVYRNEFGGRGWKGDVKVMLLDTKMIQKLGWKPSVSSSEAVRKAASDLLDSGKPQLRH